MTLSAATASELEKIKTLYAQSNRLISEGKTKQLLFFNSNSGWKPVENNKVLGFKDVGPDRMLEQASVYLYKGRVAKAVMSVDTPSGDWANKREYYMYDSGDVAFMLETHFTFLGYDSEAQKPLPEGSYVLERSIYLSMGGKEIRRLEKAYVSKSKEPVPPRFLQQIDPDVYRSVTNFPFFKLLEGDRNHEDKK